MTYKIVTSGKIKEVSLAEISRNLRVQSDVFILSDKEIYLGIISHKTLVFFATEFADYALQNYVKRDLPEAEASIHLTRKWLEDQESVSNEKLRAAYAAAYAYAANAAYHANSAAVYAAAYAADAAADAAYAAADADAAAAADAADADAVVDRDKEFLRQGNFILDFLKAGNNLFML